MGVDVIIGGKRLDSIAHYSVTEYATPIDPSEMSGGVGQISVGLAASDKSRFARRKSVVISDSAQGTVSGTITSAATANAFSRTITADSRLLPLTYERTAPPYLGTLGGLIRMYLSLVGITDGIIIDPAINARTLVAPGWSGVVLDAIKRICSGNQIEVALVSNNIVVRPIRQRVASNLRDSVVTDSIDDTNLAEEVEVFYLHSVMKFANGLVYPAGGWAEKDKIISVAAGMVTEVEIDLQPPSGETGTGMSVESVIQPTCIDYVARGVTGQSVYSVVGNDGKIVPAARWLAFGGGLEVEIGEDTRSLIVRVTGSIEEELGPFRIAASSGTSDHYSSLRVLGTAAAFDKRSIKASTGNSSDLATQDLVQIESDFIIGADAAWVAMHHALAAWTGPRLGLSVTTRGINRKGDSGEAVYPVLRDFNALYAGKTLGNFSAEWAGKSIADFNAAMLDSVSGKFENQAFGNIAGARVQHDDVWFRIIEASVTAGAITYTADRDTTIGDWNAHYAGLTLGGFNALAEGFTLGELAITPLLS